MTEDDWLRSADGMTLYRIAHNGLSQRKKFLVCVELLSRLVNLPDDSHKRLLPESTFQRIGELVAAEANGEIPSAYQHARSEIKTDDSAVTAALMGNADLLAKAVIDTLEMAIAIRDIPMPSRVVTSRDAAEWRAWSELAKDHPERPAIRARELSHFAELLREVVGNPFRPVRVLSRWRTSDTLGLARGIYEERAFDRLPLLADALMDAGCDDEQLLAHCHSPGPHVHGCWVVDLVLGKE